MHDIREESMTTIQYSKDADAFRVTNDARVTTLPRNTFYALFVDQDLRRPHDRQPQRR
jgi:hypothetical protein